MKIIEMYSIYDKESKRYDTPFFTLDAIGAKRSFIFQCQKKDAPVGFFKDSYELHKVGSFNVETGFVNTKKEPEVVLKGNQVDIGEAK